MTSFLVTNRIGKLGDLIHQDELDHIRDVKRTIDNVTKYTLVIFAVLIFFRKTVITRLATYSKWGIYLIAGGGVAALLFFEPFFIKFHELLFPQGNWSFPENSILIQLYPEYFWQTAAGIIFLATILELAAFFKLARKYQQQTTALF
jgi:integral membrane protein (TIGR01906 family)